MIQGRATRQLRHNASCSPYPNIFRNQHYISTSPSQHLPENIYKMVSNLQTITCENINALSFNKLENHQQIMNRMAEALQAQTKTVKKHTRKGQHHRRQDHAEGMREIDQQDYDEEEILKNPCFKHDLQNLFLS